jgi:hypothetical protein
MNLIKANRDPNVLIKEIAKYMVHVRLTRVAVNPNDPVNTRSSTDTVQVFTPKEFETMEAQRNSKHPFDWVRVSGYNAAYVVHDGRLEPKEEVIKDEEAEALNEVVKEEVKAAVNKEARKQRIRKSLQNTVK